MVPTPKIARPWLPHLVARERLFRLLDACGSRPATWIAAPAGFGKTCLMASYLDARRARAIWYQVDPGDDDPASLFHYLGLAGRSGSRKARPLPVWSPECHQTLPAFSRRFFEQLCQRMGPRGILVLDDCHLAHPDGDLFRVLREALHVLPEHTRVVFLSRQAPPAVMQAMLSHERMASLGWEDLRLTQEESMRLAEARCGGTLAETILEDLYRLSDGWLAGLIVLLQSAQGGQNVLDAKGRAPEDLFAYFAGEVFDHLSADLQRLLIETAVLPRTTAAMAAELTGIPDADRLLVSLCRAGHFTISRGGSEPTYEYHPLFRAFLLDRGTSRLSPTRSSELKRRAAATLMEHGDGEGALDLFEESRAWDEAVESLKRQAPAILGQGRGQRVKAWIERLPESIVANDGWLTYWLGCSLQAFDLDEGRSCFDRALALFQKAGDRAGALLAWSGLVDSYLYAWDAFAPLDAWIDWLSTAGPEAWPFPDARVDAAVATSMVGALIQRQPGHPSIAFWMQAALRVLRQEGEANARIRAGTYAALYCFWTGNFPLIREIARELKRMAEPPEASPLSVLGWKWVEACCLSCFQDVAPAKTLEIVRSALAHAEETGVHALDGMILAQAAIASIMQRDLAEADGYLDRMARASLGRNTLAYYHYLSSWRAFLGGDLPRAGMHVEEALRLARETGMVFSIILAEHACAEVSFECGQTEEADLHLQEAFRMAAQIQSDYFPFVCRLTQARFALRRSGRAEALGPLRMALIPGRTQGFLNAYWWIPEWMAELCQLALEERIEVPYVQRLVRARGLRPAVPPLHCTEWPWDLRIQTLGGFKVLRDGKALEHVKTPRRTLMLLQAIIAQGPEGAKETVLMDLLWPEASGDLAQQSLATCLHRLRQLLGVEGAITARGGRLWLDLQRCWVDAFAFERTCDPALYKGPFLPESEEGWVLPYRRRLEGIHCGVLGRGLAVTRG